MSDVLIVGGGVIGCALAREAARRGAAVTLLEAGAAVGREASGAAIGTLSYTPSSHMQEAWHALAARSVAAHRALSVALAAEVEQPPTWQWPGRLNLATSNKTEKYLRERLHEDRDAGQPGEWLDKREVHEVEPALGNRVQGAAFQPDEHGWVDAAHLTRSLAQAATRFGATIHTNSPVTHLLWEGERVVGASAGQGYRAAHTVLAAGAWSASLDARLAVPLVAVRGQALHLPRGPGEPPPIRHLISGDGIYMIPEGNGVTVGSTHERVGLQKGNTAGGVAKLLWYAVALLPTLSDVGWEQARVWSGLRSVTPDKLPLFGPDPRHPGLWWATGHFRSGIFLAPHSATLLAEALLDGQPLDERLSVERFR